jgi:hypothetical protein
MTGEELRSGGIHGHPEPETPVNTTTASRGISTLTFFSLCSRAPRTRIKPFD